MEAGYAKAEVRNQALRADLTPLAPGERPRPLLIAIAVAAINAVASLVFLLAGGDPGGSQGQVVGLIVLSAVAAAGMWAQQAWALLGFLVMLAITVVFAFLALLVAENVAAVALTLAIAGLGSWLFYKLIRVLGRMQAPPR